MFGSLFKKKTHPLTPEELSRRAAESLKAHRNHILVSGEAILSPASNVAPGLGLYGEAVMRMHHEGLLHGERALGAYPEEDLTHYTLTEVGKMARADFERQTG